METPYLDMLEKNNEKEKFILIGKILALADGVNGEFLLQFTNNDLELYLERLIKAKSQGASY
jgi:hypothetical protein